MEDDPLVREAVVPALRAAGFEVVVAKNAEQAVHIIESSTHINRLFSDVVMPGPISGVDLARFLNARCSDVPVLLAS
ncbi:response regulator [Noviherbaspirillum aerium]|uniref:response regulator n=1 Tax=Noviherbaspirillum aerium TaxID=2588497 RepID=UPI00124BDD74|nr:response regulator [Noviherbaspirillum aerium]